MSIHPIGAIISLTGEYSGSWLLINHRTDTPLDLMVKHFQDAAEATAKCEKLQAELDAERLSMVAIETALKSAETQLELLRASMVELEVAILKGTGMDAVDPRAKNRARTVESFTYNYTTLSRAIAGRSSKVLGSVV